MFVRNSNNNPTEISKIFVRDSSGNPQEICKVYIRDANGNPVLVYECQQIVVACPQCTESGIVPFYYSIDEDILRPRFSFVGNYPSNPSNPCNLGTVPPFLGQASTAIDPTSIEVNKTYWLNVGQYSSYTLGAHEQSLAPNTNTFLNLRKYNLPSTCEFCQNVDAPTQQWFNDDQYYWKKLKEAYDGVTNYPLLPGHIVTDWNTLTVRDSVYVLMKPLQRIFNEICTHPNSLPEYSGAPFCFHLDGSAGSPPIDIEKYPFYDRPILMRYFEGDALDQTTSFCGQELCSAGLWGTLDWSGGNTCYGGFHSSGSIFINLPGFGGASVGNCSTGPITWSGTTTLDVEWCGCCGYCCRNPGEFDCDPTPDPGCCCDDSCNCVVFYNQEYNDPAENPFSFVLNVQDHGTDRMLPVPTSNGTAQDCCPSTCYGPTNLTNTKKACRQVYQIPPINTGVGNMTGATDPYTDTLSFFKDMTVAVLMDSTAAQQQDNSSGSAAYVRVVLPYYVELHQNLRSHVVSLKEAQYENFISNLDGPTSNPVALSVWQAISRIFGIKLGSTFSVPQDQRIWMSSNSFSYNEYTGYKSWENVPYPFSRVSRYTTTDQKPGIWWNIKGYPTEKTTHYVALELTYSGNLCISNLFDENQLRDLENQKQIALGLRFYPVERTCPTNNKHYKHPTYQTYIVPENYQNFSNSPEFYGFVDGWEESTQSWFEANINCGAGSCDEESPLLDTAVEKDFWVYQDASSGTFKSRCLVYPRLKTYKQFLEKYYRIAST